MNNTLTPFHLAIPVDDISKARDFYGVTLNLPEGRSDTSWQDYDLFGHQLVIHQVADYKIMRFFNPVDDHAVPLPHFGVVLKWEDFNSLAERLKKDQIEFVIEPYIRFKDQPGEQATMFFYDPAGNALEFKAFKDMSKLFAT